MYSLNALEVALDKCINVNVNVNVVINKKVSPLMLQVQNFILSISIFMLFNK